MYVIPICGHDYTNCTATASPWPGSVALARWAVGLPPRWAATSNVEVGKTAYPINMGMVEREGREWSEGQNRKEEEKERGSGVSE